MQRGIKHVIDLYLLPQQLHGAACSTNGTVQRPSLFFQSSFVIFHIHIQEPKITPVKWQMLKKQQTTCFDIFVTGTVSLRDWHRLTHLVYIYAQFGRDMQ